MYVNMYVELCIAQVRSRCTTERLHASLSGRQLAEGIRARAREGSALLPTMAGAATLRKNPEEYLQKDFAALMETMAIAAGMKLASEYKNVPTRLEN